MTKKDFELIALAIKHLHLLSECPEITRRSIAWQFAVLLEETNPRFFDAERFLKACRVEV